MKCNLECCASERNPCYAHEACREVLFWLKYRLMFGLFGLFACLIVWIDWFIGPEYRCWLGVRIDVLVTDGSVIWPEYRLQYCLAGVPAVVWPDYQLLPPLRFPV